MVRYRARLGLAILLLLIAALPVAAQRELAGTAKLKYSLERLNTLGTVLMIAAHPDDENTALLAYLARGRKYRTAYLALTRGEGGQNLIGPEQGDLMGVLRTQELLAARRIDGAEQFFSRAIDFGYSKTAAETLAKWGRAEVLGDIVWVIREVRPDVIVLRFSGTPRDGHGHHQSSAILAKEAFAAAADPARYPEQLRYVEPWQAKRILWNVFSFRRGRFSQESDQPDRIDIDTGEFDPVLGFSYAEIAGMSRSQHRSQGFGAAERKGSSINSLVAVAGDPPQRDLMDGVDTTWNRVAGGAAVAQPLRAAAAGFEPEHPEKIVPLLLEARRKMAALDGPWIPIKLAQLDDTIALATGLWLDAAAERHTVTPGSTVRVNAVALNRSPYPLELVSVELDGGAAHQVAEPLPYNQRHTVELNWEVPADQPYSQPYWLRNPKAGALYVIDDPKMIGRPDTPPVLRARFRVRVGDQTIEYARPVIYRWVDRVLGERTRPLAVVPPVSVAFSGHSLVFASSGDRPLQVEVRANVPHASGEVHLDLPTGWRVRPPKAQFSTTAAGEQEVLAFTVTPPTGDAIVTAQAVARVGEREVTTSTVVIDYEHIPPQTLSPAATARFVRVDARTLARQVGYVMGAGDNVPDALRQLGCEVTLLGEETLTRSDLSRFDAIVTGVRAYNTRPDLVANQQRLLDYVKRGGTLIVQYNVLSRRRDSGAPDPLAGIGPYPLSFGRGRVSVEETPMRFLAPEHPVLQQPNHITARDFDGWIQERGLYFASEWDDRYQPLWEANDPGEKPLRGATLYTDYGDGVFIFTGLSFFRELPAGVPGAYRIFANFLSAGKARP